MSIHDQVGNAEVYGKGTRFGIGVYPVIQVEKIFEKVSAKTGADLVIFEFAILESLVESNPAGSSAGVVYDFTYAKVVAGKMRATLAACLGCDVPEITKDVSMLSVSTEQPCTGRLLRLEAAQGKPIPNEPGEYYADLYFSPLPEEKQTEEHVNELRAAAGFPPLPKKAD